MFIARTAKKPIAFFPLSKTGRNCPSAGVILLRRVRSARSREIRGQDDPPAPHTVHHLHILPRPLRGGQLTLWHARIYEPSGLHSVHTSRDKLGAACAADHTSYYLEYNCPLYGDGSTEGGRERGTR